MRSLLSLSLLGIANAGMCIVDSGEAVSDAMDAFMFTWAAMKRCGPSQHAHDQPQENEENGMMHTSSLISMEEPVKCEIDIASAVKAVNSMVNVVMEAVEQCHGFHIVEGGCVVVAGSLTEHMAGLAAATGQVFRECAPAKVRAEGNGHGHESHGDSHGEHDASSGEHGHGSHEDSHESAHEESHAPDMAFPGEHLRRLGIEEITHFLNNQTRELGIHGRFLSAKEEENKASSGMVSPIMCTLDMKDTATSIFKATRSLMKMKKHCKKKKGGGFTCASDVLDIVASFSAMGEFLAGAVGECRENSEGGVHESVRGVCAEAVNGVLHNSMQISKAGVDIARKCKAESHGRGGKAASRNTKKKKADPLERRAINTCQCKIFTTPPRSMVQSAMQSLHWVLVPCCLPPS